VNHPLRHPGLLEKLRLHPTRSRKVIRLAYPVALGMLSITLLSVVDTAMLGRLGPIPLAAAGIASIGYFMLAFSLSGIGIGVQTLVARRFGEQNYPRCGEVLNAGLLLGLIGGIPFVALSSVLASALAPALSGDPQVSHFGEIYLRYRFWGATFLFLNQTYRGFFNGLGETKQQMASAILVTVSNILLDYALIFGHFGLPAMGVAGAAVASTIATGIGSAYFALISLSSRYRQRFRLYQRVAFARIWVRPILRLSLPVIGQRFLSEGSFFAFFSIVARIGTLELAASNVIRSVVSLSIMPAFGIGVAAAALVGQNLGASCPEKAEGFAWEAAKLAAYLMGGVGLLFTAFPQWIFMIYTNDPAVIALGRAPLILLGISQALGGTGIVLSQALQGAGNTRFVMLGELIVCVAFYLPTAYLLGLTLRLGIVGAWLGEVFYWLVLAFLMSWKFRQGTWKTIRV
jgi:putative MATE family efflux protein